MRSYWNCQLHVFLILFILVSLQQGYAQLDTANIAGVVLDRAGAVVPGATVKVINVKTDRVWNTKTASVGEYAVSTLPVGSYRVEVSSPGFKKADVAGIDLHAAETARINLNLDVGGAEETVTVTAAAAMVNSLTSETGGTIQAQSVSNLPLNGRDFTALIALVPGSMQTGNFGQNSLGGFETGMAGVNVLLDGTDATRIDVNATSTQLGRQESRISRASIDSIEEFTVLSGVYSAEYGRSNGDVVNVITKSGGNRVHGSVFDYFRNDAMDAKNYFAHQNTPLRLNQFGGNLSGPIVKDRVFYFVNYEGVRQTVDTPTTATVYSDASRAKFVPSMIPVIAAVPHSNNLTPVLIGGTPRPDLAFYDGTLNNTLREDTGSVKLDWNATQSNTFALRYNIADSDTSTQYGVAQDQVSPSTSRNHLLKLTWNSTLRGNLINQFGVALNRPQTDSLGGGGNFPIFQCSTFWGCTDKNSFFTTPGPALFSNRRPQYSIQALDTISWVKGRNTIHAGFDIRHNVTHDALDPQYFLSYASINDLYNNVGIQFDTLGHTSVSVQNTNYGFFIQNDLRLTSSFTLNAGLRYDYNSVLSGDQIGNFDIATLSLLPKGAGLYKPDRNNFAPRLGFSWDPFKNGKTVVRGGGGIFYNPTLTGAALSLAGNYQQSFSANYLNLAFGVTTCTPSLTIAFPLPVTLPVCSPSLPTSVNALDPNMRDSYSEHWSFGIQNQITKNSVAEINYVANHGVKLPAGAAYAGQELNYSPFGGTVLSDRFGNIRRLGNFVSSSYNSLQASYRYHMSRGLNIDANYTWAHEFDDGVNILAGAYQNSRNPKGDYASGDIDVRHNFTIGVVYDIPALGSLPKRFVGGWQISPLVQVRSGLPVNIAMSAPFLGIDQLRPNFASGSARPSNYSVPNNQLNAAAFTAPAAGTYGNVPRNFGRGPGFVQADLAVSKTGMLSERVKMQFRAEMYNLLNHPNFANPVGFLNDPNFGKSMGTIGNHIGTGTSRQAQLALKLLF